MLEVNVLCFEELSDKEKEEWDGFEDDCFLKIVHNDKTVCLQSDGMEPEDARFYRDLSWIPGAIKEAYELGKKDTLMGTENRKE